MVRYNGRPKTNYIDGVTVDLQRRNLFRVATTARGGAIQKLSGNQNDFLNGEGKWESMDKTEELLELLLIQLQILNLHMANINDGEIKEEDID